MKNPFIYALVLFTFSNAVVFSQEDESSASSAKTKNYIFTDQERDSLQLWFYDRATVMGLNEAKRDEFYGIVLNYLGKARTLQNKKQGYSHEKEQENFEQLLKMQHEEVKAILDEKQYAYYLETYNKILRRYYKRKGWE